ncbi:MAG: RagB/SusD family nutrient uptake outer membrane protein [Bacteroidetes bacterium]|nr:RagB/SusD family nutrient uptake outer membrane protein [Bacteroidota bacterium]
MKIKNAYTYLATCAVVSLLASCNKYLDIEPKGKQLLTTVSDYDLWLNSSEIEGCEPQDLNLFGDNVDNISLTNPPTGISMLAYLWYPQLNPDVTAYPLIWGQHYKNIYYFNTVLTGIDDAGSGTAAQKASLKAEALLGRALEYLYLVNEYGKPYDSASANTDLAVPFVTSNDLGSLMPGRSTVQQIYDRIITDIQTAIPDLPANNNKNRYRGSVGAAYSVLARTYLYRRNYPKAQEYAQLALGSGPNAVLDYNTKPSIENSERLVRSAEAIYARTAMLTGATERPAVTFLRSFDKNDFRLKFWYTPTTNLNFPTRGTTFYYQSGGRSGPASFYANWGTGVAEMRLIIAEAAARNGDLATALRQLDSVRKCRIAKANYTPFSSADGPTVLQAVLSERVFEMPYNGTRWFDMRRLNAEGRMPTVNRLDPNGNVIAALAPNSARYTLQIPIQVLFYNPDWPQNP